MTGLAGGRRLAMALAGVWVLGLSGCWASVGAPIDDDYYYDAPPPAFIATAPVYYYDGRPTYWYHGHWHYREDGHWRRYRQEPAPLRDFRSGMGPAAPMNRGVPMQRGRMAPMAPGPGPGPAGVPMQRGRMAPAPGPARGAPAGRGPATPRMWERGRPERLQH